MVRQLAARRYWDWALVGIMMLVLAPQISQDYMVLTLVGFSYVLAGCLVLGDRRAWIEFAIAALLVGTFVVLGRIVAFFSALLPYGTMITARSPCRRAATSASADVRRRAMAACIPARRITHASARCC